MKASADALIAQGLNKVFFFLFFFKRVSDISLPPPIFFLKKVGYQFVNLDDCWAVGRTDQGVIIADPVRFPDGIQVLFLFHIFISFVENLMFEKK